jgi:cytoskeletal protein CcmA (bactofilin family)
MDSAEDQETSSGKSISIIGPNITIRGNIEATGDPSLADLQIDGHVVGDIRCATVVLSESSSVAGNIFAERARVSGSVDGGITSNDLAVEATARITGDVTYDRLRVAAGGMIQGTMAWKGAQESTKLKLVEATPEPPKAVFID